MGFTSKFFSVAGQKERLSNVGKYLQLGASKITAGVIPAPKNTDQNFKSTSTIGKIADAIVNNPKTAALAVTGAAYAGKAIMKSSPSIVGKATQAARTVKQKVTGQKPGLVKPAQAGGLIQPAPASPTPVSANAGTITSTSSRATQPRKSTKRRKTRKKASKRTKKRTSKRSRKKRFGTAKQYARPGGKKVFYAKNGRPYIKKANGQARFVKGKTKRK